MSGCDAAQAGDAEECVSKNLGEPGGGLADSLGSMPSCEEQGVAMRKCWYKGGVRRGIGEYKRAISRKDGGTDRAIEAAPVHTPPLVLMTRCNATRGLSVSDGLQCPHDRG